MGAIYNEQTKLYDWVSPHKSWWPNPTNLTEVQVAYLMVLEEVFRVKNVEDEWVNYTMAPHQVSFHLYDYSLCRGNSKIKIVKKSRNTSFTVSSVINLDMASVEFDNPSCPVVKLNASESEALISNFNAISRHIVPVVDDGIYMPFNPDNIKTTAVKKMVLPNGNAFMSFPANSDAAENIRGTRTHLGLIDEANFMRKFVDLFTALRKASYGTTANGEEHFQLLIGTTLKGETPYVKWQEELEKKTKPLPDNPYISTYNNFVMFDWPIFDRIIFEKYYQGKPNEEIPFTENEELISLVPWQHKKMLWEDYCHDYNIFLEENMAVKVDSDEQFYPMMLIMSVLSDKTKMLFEEFDTINEKYRNVKIGIDVASVHDYFVITLIGETFDGHLEQFYLNYQNKVEIQAMENACVRLMHSLNKEQVKWKCAIDANGIGIQITQNLQRIFGEDKIRGIKGGTLKDSNGNSHRLNEYGHTKVKRAMSDKRILLIEDEILIRHFAGFNYEYKCESTGYGHGDITMAVLYAMILDEYKSIGDGRMYSSSEGKEIQNDRSNWWMKDFKKNRGIKRNRML